MSSQHYKTETSWLDIFLIFLAVLIVLMALGGCYTEKKAIKQVDKAIVNYPVPSSQEFRRFFPIVTTGQSFSTDSAAYKASLDSLYNTKGWYETLIRSIEKPEQHPIAQDTICPELAKELIAAQKLNEYQEQYIISMTDDFNHIQPIVVNRIDTVLDKSIPMELEAKVQQLEKRNNTLQTDLQISNNKNQKLQSRCNKLFLSLAGLLLLIGGFIWFSIKKRNLKTIAKVTNL